MESNFTPTLKLEHADERGEIYSITLPGDKEMLLIHSVEGSFRGGHSHTVDERVMLLTGKMRYFKRVTAAMRKEIYGLAQFVAHAMKRDPWEESESELNEGDISFNWAHEQHMGEFLEDSWLVEWKLHTKKGEWKNLDYAPWREKVAAHAAG